MSGKSIRLSLGKDKLFSLRGVKKAKLHCESGKLWVTGSGEGDLVVGSGQKVNLKAADTLIIQSGADSLFTVEI
jgi:mannose-6-phosphate isomerase-like protein (cupin superfamily)